MKEKYLTIIWALIVTILGALCIYEYIGLSYNLQSIYDEGFFYITSVLKDKTSIGVRPLTLSQDAIHALIPNIEQCDVLALRRYAYWMKGISFVFLIGCSCFYIFRRYGEMRIHIYLSLVASYLLVATLLLPSIVLNMNDIVSALIAVSFGLCLLSSVSSNRIVKYMEIVLLGVVIVFVMLCNAPAGCMLAALCALYLIIDDYRGIKDSFKVLLFGLTGILFGSIITHFFIISIPDIIDFVHQGVSHTTASAQTGSHSLTKIISVIFIGMRDLFITTLALCGITYIGKLTLEKFKRSWLTLLIVLFCFAVMYVWQAKPSISIAAVLCWFLIMFIAYRIQHDGFDKKDIWLLLFSFVLPLGVVFGTNTSILGKATDNCITWGILLFLLYYLSRPKVRRYAVFGIFVVTCLILQKAELRSRINPKDTYQFEHETPISRMNLNKNQVMFYNEVYDVLAEKGYKEGKDTLLGFCFNELTIVAMGANPYTRDQSPDEFLAHDFNELPCPKYIILSEWDSIVLFDCFRKSNWGFPESYEYFKMNNNPDPNSGYNYTQSMIYCKQ